MSITVAFKELCSHGHMNIPSFRKNADVARDDGWTQLVVNNCVPVRVTIKNLKGKNDSR